MAATPSIRSARRDRRLYTWFAIFMPLIVLIGFARTYYLKGLLNGPPIPSFLVHVHGAVMTYLCLLTCVAVDTFKNHRLHPAFVWATIAVIASQPLRIFLRATQLWMNFAAWLINFWR